jgi:hypothetical protein
MLAISPDSHYDNAAFCLPLFFVRVPVISAFGRPLSGSWAGAAAIPH